MTRFARAKGSKASNERLPESATSWSEMKQDLLNTNKEAAEKQQREEILQRRNENYQTFLQEKEKEEYNKTAWAEFQDIQPNNSNKKRKLSINNKDMVTPKKKNKTDLLIKNMENLISDESDSELDALKSKIEVILKKQSTENGEESDSDAPPEEIGIKEKPKEIVLKKIKNKKTKLQIIVNDKDIIKEKRIKNDVEVNDKTEGLTDRDKKKIAKKQERYKKRLEKKKKKREEIKMNKLQENGVLNNDKIVEDKIRSTTDSVKENNNLNKQDLLKIKKKKEKRLRQLEKRKHFKETKAESDTNNVKDNNESNKIEDNRFQKKNTIELKKNTKKHNKDLNNAQRKPRNKDGKGFQRKTLIAETMIINGKSVDIDYVDGFPVKKEDADRLKQLRKEMISKGLPRSEINAALKLERRRAEKALAREKKNVCFNCRISGHILAECPELGKDQVAQSTGTGICFKCGSTEHTHFECKVVKGMDYKFAQCFICNEQGHIARQCPDNQRGLYPKGGCCNVCGDVTHLKKDCPKYQSQQAQVKKCFNIEMLNNSNPDVLDNAESNSNAFISVTKQPNKIIKF